MAVTLENCRGEGGGKTVKNGPRKILSFLCFLYELETPKKYKLRTRTQHVELCDFNKVDRNSGE